MSELLGSFSDNELSPECLDGAQRLLKPGGISIPCSYTSFLAPITSCKMQEAVRTYKVGGCSLSVIQGMCQGMGVGVGGCSLVCCATVWVLAAVVWYCRGLLCLKGVWLGVARCLTPCKHVAPITSCKMQEAVRTCKVVACWTSVLSDTVVRPGRCLVEPASSWCSWSFCSLNMLLFVLLPHNC